MPPGFGISTRRTGWGRYVSVRSASPTAASHGSSPAASMLSNVTPSTPGPPTVLFGEGVGIGEDVRPMHLVVQQVEAIGRFLLGLGVYRLLEPPELCWRCQAHANLPPLASLRRTPNQGPFPLHQFCCLADPNGTVDPSDTQRGFCLHAEVRAATPRRAGAPALRHALCRRATPTTPVSDPALIGRLLRRDPAAFPVRMAGRRSRRPFRGLLGLHLRCGPSTR